jgi:hypothetical protein
MAFNQAPGESALSVQIGYSAEFSKTAFALPWLCEPSASVGSCHWVRSCARHVAFGMLMARGTDAVRLGLTWTQLWQVRNGIDATQLAHKRAAS